MSTHSSTFVRKSFQDLVNSANRGENDGFKSVLNAHCRDIGRVIANNQYLHTLNGSSVYRQLKELKTKCGIDFKKETYSNLKTGRKLTCSITLFIVLAEYWGLSVRDMLADSEEFERIVAEKLPNLGGLSGRESNG